MNVNFFDSHDTITLLLFMVFPVSVTHVRSCKFNV